MSPDYDHLTLMQKVEVFENALKTTPGDDLAKLLWLKSPSSEVSMLSTCRDEGGTICLGLVRSENELHAFAGRNVYGRLRSWSRRQVGFVGALWAVWAGCAFLDTRRT